MELPRVWFALKSLRQQRVLTKTFQGPAMVCATGDAGGSWEEGSPQVALCPPP